MARLPAEKNGTTAKGTEWALSLNQEVAQKAAQILHRLRAMKAKTAHENVLKSAIARGRHDDKATIDFLMQAVADEYALNYSEPPAWYPPVRPMLAALYLRANN